MTTTPMTLYVVVAQVAYEDWELIGAYSTKANAEEAAIRFNTQVRISIERGRDGYAASIVECQLDQDHPYDLA